MKKLYRFTVNPTTDLDDAWCELEAKGIEPAYGSEEETGKYIYGYADGSVPVLSPHILSLHECELPSIDWHNQWETHGPDYKDGYVHVDLGLFSIPSQRVLRLRPGPGFGDLSHPTTRLVLELMGSYLSDTPVIDIGCGSGILSLAAAASGASYVYGIDIEEEALVHSTENAKINELGDRCRFIFPEACTAINQEPVLILMNMITSEQSVAWHSLPTLHRLSGTCITSGMRKEEKKEYLHRTQSLGWKLVEEREEDGWLACVFSLAIQKAVQKSDFWL